MTEKRNFFSFIWKIKDFSFIEIDLVSPTFFENAMSETKWKLHLYPDSSMFPGCVACYFYRENNDQDPDKIELDFELSFLTGDGSVLVSETYLKKECTKVVNGESQVHAKRDEVFLQKKDLFIPDDTLTIRFRVWDYKESLSLSGKVLAETQIEIERRYFIGTIEKFSSAGASCNTLICMKSSSLESFLSSIYLCVSPDGKLSIEIKPVNISYTSMYRCKIFIRDIFGKKMKSGQGNFRGKETQCIPLTILKEHLMQNRENYLPDDVLNIDCEIMFPTGKTIEKIDKPEYGFDYQDTQAMISNETKTNFSLKEHHSESITTLRDDFISMLLEGISYDTKLKTATESFPAHTNVLSARSSVFKSMFSTDMKEKTNNCVEIGDLDADTVRRMLLFMYSDTLDDLEYESAKRLYFAADKYNIVSLRKRCSNILKQNLLLSNCCDVLLLADKHQDQDLKNVVQGYISNNDEGVLSSDEWKNLEKNHPHLTLEVFHGLYMKIRKVLRH